MEHLNAPDMKPEKNRSEISFESFESAKKKLARGVINNASVILGLFIIFVAITVLVTDIKLTSFVDIAAVSLTFFVIFCASYLMYINTSGAGSRAGVETDVYKASKARHDRLRNEIIEKKAIGKLPKFCREYVSTELKNARLDILAKVGIEYDEYEEKYLGKTKKEIAQYDLSDFEREAIIAANNVSPIKLSADMIFQSNNGRRNRNPLGTRPISVKTFNYITRFFKSFAFAAIPTIVVLEMIGDFSWNAFATALLKISPIVAHAFYGYEFGYKYITVHVVDYMDSQSDIMQEFVHSIE